MVTTEFNSFEDFKHAAWHITGAFGGGIKFHVVGRDTAHVSIVYLYDTGSNNVLKYVAERTEIPTTDNWITTNEIQIPSDASQFDGDPHIRLLFHPSLEVRELSD